MSTLADSSPSRHRLLPEKADQMASATLRKAEPDLLKAIGRALDEARYSLRWSLKELTAEIERATRRKRDERQVARWIEGTERQQFDVLLAVEALRGPLVIALARLSDQIEIDTVIRVKAS